MTTNPSTLERLESLYFSWLTNQIHFNYRHVRNDNAPQYWTLMEALWNKPFSFVVAHDENRIQDGLELRYLFLTDEGNHGHFQAMHFLHDIETISPAVQEFRGKPCRVLEVLIALSRRLEFQEGSVAGWWAWRLIVNLELHKMKDPVAPVKLRRIDDALDALVWRTYERNGEGGFFPLAHPDDDQRKIEIWYQMAAYLAEFGHP